MSPIATPPERTPPISGIRKPQALVWLTCVNCHQPIIPVVQVESAKTSQGQMVVRFMNLVIFAMDIECPYCGTVRHFRSQKAPG